MKCGQNLCHDKNSVNVFYEFDALIESVLFEQYGHIAAFSFVKWLLTAANQFLHCERWLAPAIASLFAILFLQACLALMEMEKVISVHSPANQGKKVRFRPRPRLTSIEQHCYQSCSLVWLRASAVFIWIPLPNADCGVVFLLTTALKRATGILQWCLSVEDTCLSRDQSETVFKMSFHYRTYH